MAKGTYLLRIKQMITVRARHALFQQSKPHKPFCHTTPIMAILNGLNDKNAGSLAQPESCVKRKS